jgi:hypothetical protein
LHPNQFGLTEAQGTQRVHEDDGVRLVHFRIQGILGKCDAPRAELVENHVPEPGSEQPALRFYAGNELGDRIEVDLASRAGGPPTHSYRCGSRSRK